MIFIQVAVVLAACALTSWLLARLWQPRVIGQMIAGVLLGPSLLGLVWPEGFAWLFPAGGMDGLKALGQIGLVFYMFMTGLKVDWTQTRRNLHSSSAVSLSGVIVPCLLGAGVGLWLHGTGHLSSGGQPALVSSLFLAAALSVTALPVLARIIQELRIEARPSATIALSAAVIDDVIAWCLVAGVLAIADGDAHSIVFAVAGGLAMVAVAAFAVRPAMKLRLFDATARPLSETGFAAAIVILASLAWLGEVTGLHAVFGAFLAGLAVPRGAAVAELTRRLEPVTLAVLLPLFFANAGLATQIGLLNTGGLWVALGLIVAAAVAGKGLTCWLAARLAGMDARESLSVGILMNARGLTGVVMASIGLQKGIISPAIYTIIVIMCLVTTAAAPPLLNFLYRAEQGTPKM